LDVLEIIQVSATTVKPQYLVYLAISIEKALNITNNIVGNLRNFGCFAYDNYFIFLQLSTQRAQYRVCNQAVLKVYLTKIGLPIRLAGKPRAAVKELQRLCVSGPSFLP
jgi:hypothetical protein